MFFSVPTLVKIYNRIYLNYLSPKTHWLKAQGSRLKVCSLELRINPLFKIKSSSKGPQSSVLSTQHLCSILILLLLPWAVSLVPCTAVAGTATVTIAWDKNPEPDIAGYKMHYGTTSGHYEYSVDVGNFTSCTISGLAEDTTYYFAATAHNSSSITSDYSAELAYTIPVADTDGDGIPDKDETGIYGTDPNKVDTDEDGIGDGAEITFWGNDWNADMDNDGIINLLDPDSDNDGYPDGTSTAPPATTSISPLPAPTLEAGEIQLDNNWQYVEFKKTYSDPIVVAKSLSLNDSDPAVIRIQNSGINGFEICVQEWDYLDGPHALESVSYLVMERGTYTLEDGSKVEAGSFKTGRTKGFETVSFTESFQEIPVVIASVQSTNEIGAVTGRIRSIDTQGFIFRMQNQERNVKKHAVETIGYIAWEPSKGIIDEMPFEIAKTGDTVTHSFYTIQFAQNFATPPAFMADMQTGNNMNTANIRWQNKDAYAVEVQIDEEQSKDDETRHGTEVVGYMVFSHQFN